MTEPTTTGAGGGQAEKVTVDVPGPTLGLPKPHQKYLVQRDGFVFTATPCYGMHAPWWVVMTMDGEAPPVPMKDSDKWRLLDA